MAGSKILNLTLSAGQSVTLGSGFLWASILAGTGATFTITSDAPITPLINDGASGPISTAYSTGPAPSQEGWGDHVIAATGGSVYISYCKG